MIRALWHNTVFRHVLLWLGAWLTLYLVIRFGEDHRTAIDVTTPMMLAGPVIVYAHFFVLTHLFERRRYLQYVLAAVAIILLSGFWAQLVHSLVVRDPSNHTSGLGVAVFFIAFSTGFRYFRRGMSRQFRLQEVESRQLRTELALLRSQINPHFLFNTLNSLYALSLDRSARLPDAILKLSRLMRYVLDSSRHQTVPLSEELGFLESYVGLEKLRFGNGGDIHLRIEGDPTGLRIPPMILVPFVENGFKHGVSRTGAGGYLHADLVVRDRQLCFRVENGKPDPTDASEPRDGTGLAITARRLELLYPQAHRLRIEEEDAVFRVELILETR